MKAVAFLDSILLSLPLCLLQLVSAFVLRDSHYFSVRCLDATTEEVSEVVPISLPIALVIA